ncbi:hypothetical protein BDW22DRAFT_902690 [Trametopsis cervina]|nr:hypothetical protein BDW22DRAFT_902690 [Trametopsis cervina]
MISEGPYVEISPESVLTWERLNKTHHRSDTEVEAMYTRAHEFLLKTKKRLEDEYGWRANVPHMPHKALFSLSSSSGTKLVLPRTFALFLASPASRKWTGLTSLKTSEQPSCHIADLPPLQDMFYALQSILPGLFLIVRIERTGKWQEYWSGFALPDSWWAKANTDVLHHILGEERFAETFCDGEIAHALRSVLHQRPGSLLSDDYQTEAGGRSRRSSGCSTLSMEFRSWSPDINAWEHEEALDFTACSAEDCGYCGRCGY